MFKMVVLSLLALAVFSFTDGSSSQNLDTGQESRTASQSPTDLPSVFPSGGTNPPGY
jgi:hypothetical protein